MGLPKHIEHWDDERRTGNGVIVTLHYGYSFEPSSHEGVRGFDTVREARTETRRSAVYRCKCAECAEALSANHGGI